MSRIELQQVLINLIVNANHALPEGGRLRIGTETLAPRARNLSKSRQPQVEPDWRVTGLGHYLLPQAEGDTGERPNQTSLMMEGCGDMSPIRILEAWSRHTLVWLNDIESDGSSPLHELWRG